MNKSNPVDQIPVIKYQGNCKETIQDPVITEHPLHLYIREKFDSSLLCTPTDLEQLVLGHLYAAGIIWHASDVAELIWHSDREVEVALALSQPLSAELGSSVRMLEQDREAGPLPNYVFRCTDLLARMREFSQASPLFLETGGVHSCAIASSQELFHLSEDIGRHNAVDKVLGKVLLSDLDLSDKFLLTSGRIASDLASKAVQRGIQMILSVSAPTRDAVRLAEESGITLAGFVRGDRMNVYCHAHRILD